MAEDGQEAEQPLQRILAEVAPEQLRHVGPGQAEQPPGLGLGNAALADDGIDAGGEFGLDEVRVGAGEAQIGEDVAAAAFDGGLGYGCYPASSVDPS